KYPESRSCPGFRLSGLCQHLFIPLLQDTPGNRIGDILTACVKHLDHSDDLALRVQDRAATVAGIDRSVDLDEVFDLHRSQRISNVTGLHRTAQAGDNPPTG